MQPWPEDDVDDTIGEFDGPKVDPRTMYRTRYWCNEEGNNGIQFRTDCRPMVWYLTNLGWLPIGNTPEDETEAEKFAEEAAGRYNEVDKKRAEYMAGW